MGQAFTASCVQTLMSGSRESRGVSPPRAPWVSLGRSRLQITSECTHQGLGQDSEKTGRGSTEGFPGRVAEAGALGELPQRSDHCPHGEITGVGSHLKKSSRQATTLRTPVTPGPPALGLRPRAAGVNHLGGAVGTCQAPMCLEEFRGSLTPHMPVRVPPGTGDPGPRAQGSGRSRGSAGPALTPPGVGWRVRRDAVPGDGSLQRSGARPGGSMDGGSFLSLRRRPAAPSSSS